MLAIGELFRRRKKKEIMLLEQLKAPVFLACL
jgi:hypothetical protein